VHIADVAGLNSRRRIVIQFQAHRGGFEEAPENTLASLRHAWSIEGAVPEIDLRTTRDHALICLHDPRLARTTNAPDGIKDADVCQLLLDDIRKWDAGGHFHRRYAKERVPTFDECVAELLRDDDRRLYLDIKHVDPLHLERVLGEREIASRVILASGQRAELEHMRRAFPDIDTMTWCAGAPASILRTFGELEAAGFSGLTQVQLHLETEQSDDGIAYAPGLDFLRQAQDTLSAVGIDLQVRPFDFDPPSLRSLLDVGIHWFVADAPKRFAACLRAATEA